MPACQNSICVCKCLVNSNNRASRIPSVDAFHFNKVCDIRLLDATFIRYKHAHKNPLDKICTTFCNPYDIGNTIMDELFINGVNGERLFNCEMQETTGMNIL